MKVLTNKERFLKRLEEQIKIFQQAHEFNRHLPDTYFDILGNMSGIEVVDVHPEITNNHYNNNANGTPNERSAYEYGDYKKLVVEILTEEDKSLRKADIIKIASEKLNKENVDDKGSITNAISSLTASKIVRKYEPKFKIRGSYWTLSQWWENDVLIEKYVPVEPNGMDKYFNPKYL